jgi:hypothetical protein
MKEEFVVVRKKRLMKHGGQAIKQVSKPKKILEHLSLLEPMIQEKPQHSGSHVFYLNMQHCNVSLSFDKIQLTIVLI